MREREKEGCKGRTEKEGRGWVLCESFKGLCWSAEWTGHHRLPSGCSLTLFPSHKRSAAAMHEKYNSGSLTIESKILKQAGLAVVRSDEPKHLTADVVRHFLRVARRGDGLVLLRVGQAQMAQDVIRHIFDVDPTQLKAHRDVSSVLADFVWRKGAACRLL